uniref:Uncharacterized protein n=1 Tax=Euplotes harpa TaxID=151035 RepID=A0A7S3N6N6_9SPIT|mmetsp:Transcript_17037/g.19643  ORF Transcript_17037/g.19643 Transcript_17037/m.19643 type:complete len:103 (+) Transcript_17037:204-512(+)
MNKFGVTTSVVTTNQRQKAELQKQYQKELGVQMDLQKDVIHKIVVKDFNKKVYKMEKVFDLEKKNMVKEFSQVSGKIGKYESKIEDLKNKCISLELVVANVK